MTTPIVTEIPLQVGPAIADSFLGPASQGATPGTAMRELDRRRSDGIDVRLLWNQVDGRVAVAVVDSKTGESFEIEPERHEALAAFHHPYSYAALNRGTTTGSLSGRVHLKH
jgi:hypothetical protein